MIKKINAQKIKDQSARKFVWATKKIYKKSNHYLKTKII
jgi:hypothetical protein